MGLATRSTPCSFQYYLLTTHLQWSTTTPQWTEQYSIHLTWSISLRAMTPLNSNTNIEQTVQPPATSQADRIIEIETYNIYSVNKVLLQQILETVGQITKKALHKSPQQVKKLEPLVLELYRQLTCFLFSLEAGENWKSGQISIFPDVQLLVTKVWNHIWKTLEERK